MIYTKMKIYAMNVTIAAAGEDGLRPPVQAAEKMLY